MHPVGAMLALTGALNGFRAVLLMPPQGMSSSGGAPRGCRSGHVVPRGHIAGASMPLTRARGRSRSIPDKPHQGMYPPWADPGTLRRRI